jgi:hypothetical protein
VPASPSGDNSQASRPPKTKVIAPAMAIVVLRMGVIVASVVAFGMAFDSILNKKIPSSLLSKWLGKPMRRVEHGCCV